MKHRFGRMESHLTSLAKTVAQISLELKSMRAIEELIYSLSQDMQHLRNSNFHGAMSNLNLASRRSSHQRSSSEPNIIETLPSKRVLSTNNNSNDRQVHFWEKPMNGSSQSSWTSNQDQRSGAAAATFANPRKIKKLTKLASSFKSKDT